MTEISMEEPGTGEPLILEKLSDLEDQEDYLSHYPDIRGYAVVNPIGDEVGIVEDLYVNPRNHQVEMAAINFTGIAGIGGKHVLVPVEELQILDDAVRILTHAEKIRLALSFMRVLLLLNLITSIGQVRQSDQARTGEWLRQTTRASYTCWRRGRRVIGCSLTNPWALGILGMISD